MTYGNPYAVRRVEYGAVCEPVAVQSMWNRRSGRDWYVGFQGLVNEVKLKQSLVADQLFSVIIQTLAFAPGVRQEARAHLQYGLQCNQVC